MDHSKRRLASQLCAAVNYGDTRSVQLYLSKGASPNLVGSKGVAPIHLAVGKETEKNIRCLKMLLQHGADPNIRSSEGLTPLHVAALWGCYQNLKLLLMNGGDPNIKDNEGNTPAHLAEQEDNRRCASLLQEYQSSSADTEEQDFPQFKYSVYSHQADTSSYPESDYSFSSRSSMISDFGEVPLSSTRLSCFLNLSNMNGRPSCREVSFNRPSVLSSTRISASGPAGTTAAPKEDASRFKEALITKDNEEAVSTNGTISPSNAPTEFFSRRASRKSVSFRNIDEFFPVFSPESSKQSVGGEINQCTDTLPFDMSEYSDFLDSGRLATVLPQQGIDVTSPDHVFVFCRDSSESTEEDLEKTVVSHCALKLSNDETEGQNNKEPPVNPSKRQEQSHVGSSSSGTSSSHYSSCESDHYTSCLDAPVPPGPTAFPLEEGAEFDKNPKQDSTVFENELNGEKNILSVQAEPRTHSKPETMQPLFGLLDKLTLSEEQRSEKDVLEACSGSFLSTARNRDVVRQDAKTSEEKSGLIFQPSPFVTGRTRSRLSRCSMRTSRTPVSLLITSSLFEDTLPTPVRTFRQTPRSQGSEQCFNSPNTPSHTSDSSERLIEGDSLPEESQDMQSSTLRGPSVSNSQADTLILHKSVTDSAEGSQSLNDTVILDKIQEDSVNVYERNLAEIILAVRGQNKDLSKDGEFLTDDLTSSDEAKVEDPTAEELVDDFKNDDVWVTEDYSSRSDSASSSSTSSCLSPRRSTEDSDPPCTPGTGSTPRYSMSRLSSSRRPQRLADLSFTPGGRPVIQDPDEPVEYLYTDTEQGHKLIETHVPPTSDTSLSSSTSTSISDETVLYDWRSLQTEIKSNKGKENQQPEMRAQEEEHDKSESNLLPETRGMTDRELRLRLVELGESPGPISSRTRPTYLRRLCRLLQEENCNTQHHKEQSDHPHKDLGYSPELSRVLKTFQLPDSHADEQALSQQFDQPDQNRKWREGIIKSSFNYLLLDPRVTKNLPFRSHTMTPQECFQTFIHAIFYVGKGKRSRPYSHLYEALEYYRGEKTAKKLCPKVQHILQVWTAGQGAISLHCFQNVIPVEAYTREACMVEAIGLKMLTNQKRGDFYGVVSNWELRRKRELGIHLLYRALQIFLAEGERQLRPADIRQ